MVVEDERLELERKNKSQFQPEDHPFHETEIMNSNKRQKRASSDTPFDKMASPNKVSPDVVTDRSILESIAHLVS